MNLSPGAQTTMLKDYLGRLAFVTGAASGIGLAIAEALAAAGLKVALADLDVEGARRAAARLQEAIAVPLDVRARAEWVAALDAAEAAFGPLAVLVSNAGVAGSRLSLAETSPEAWAWTREINLDGTFHALNLGTRRLLASGRPGHVVATASLGAFLVWPGNGVYSATKAAVVALCEALRRELEGAQVGVSVLCPSLVRTALIEANAGRAPEAVPIGEHEPELEAQMREGKDPAEVARLVLQAIEERRFWVFTHPELGGQLAARAAEIQAALA